MIGRRQPSSPNQLATPEIVQLYRFRVREQLIHYMLPMQSAHSLDIWSNHATITQLQTSDVFTEGNRCTQAKRSLDAYCASHFLAFCPPAVRFFQACQFVESQHLDTSSE